jgi:hypothetical protein
VDIEFDPKKNAANLRKHGVSLAEGDGVLNDPLALTIEDETAQGEQRFLTLGMNVLGGADGRRVDPAREVDSGDLGAQGRTQRKAGV